MVLLLLTSGEKSLLVPSELSSHLAKPLQLSALRSSPKSVTLWYLSSSLPRLPSQRPRSFRAAWAIVLARYCDTDDVSFGATVSGRQAPVHGLENMAGPMIATVPVRVQTDRKITVSRFLLDIQGQASSTVPYELFGLQNITKVSQDARDTCDFSSLLVIQPPAQTPSAQDSSSNMLTYGETEQSRTDEAMQNYFNYPLVLISNIFDDRIQ